MRSFLTGLSVFLSLIIITQYLAYQRYIIATENEIERAKDEADAIRDNLKSSLSYSLAATKTLAFIVDQYGVPKNFDSIASVILSSSKYIDALELTEGGSITHVYPLKGNESVIGYNVLEDPRRGPEALKAIERKSLYFAGPFELKQGGTAVVGRLPIFHDKKFIGFSVVLIKLGTLLKAGGIDRDDSDFEYQLGKINTVTSQEELFLPATFSVNDAHAATIEVPDGEWTLYVKNKKPAEIFIQVLPFSLLGIFFSVTAGLFVWQLVRQPERLNILVKIRTSQVNTLNRLYQFTTRINQLMVKLDNEKQVFQEVCNIAVETGSFTFAWIAIVDHDNQRVNASAFAGNEKGYLQMVVPIDLSKSFKGPIATVLSTNTYIYCNDIKSDPLFQPWAQEAIKRGYCSCIVLPLRKDGKIVASLNLYSSTGDRFDEGEIRLLLDVSDDISFTLENIERNRKFHEAVRQTEAEKIFSDSMINSLPGIFYLYDRNFNFKKWNKNLEIVSGYSTDEVLKLSPLDLFPEDQRALVSERIASVFISGNDEVIADLLTKDNRRVPYYFNGRKIQLGDTEYLIGMGIDITERVRAERELIERTEEIRKLTGYLQQIREDERRNISREIHDELGQQLTGLKMDSSWLRKHLEGDSKAVERLQEMNLLIDDTIKTVRRIASQLRPGILDDLGLIAAIDWQGTEFEKRTGVKVNFDSNVNELKVNEKLSTNIFRIFQEALTNVARHANASAVDSYLNASDEIIELVVKDNGSGLNHNKMRSNSFGIVGMKERALLFEGDLTIGPNSPSGTVVRLVIPVTTKIFIDHEVPDIR
jgi:PAS domain S-box-containing protein